MYSPYFALHSCLMEKAILLALLLATPNFSQDRHSSKLGKILYRSGQAALVLAHSLDVGSSWGKHELNPLLQGPDQTFGTRGAAIKFGVVGLGLVAGELIVRKHPKFEPYVGIADFAVAGVEGAVVVNNLHYSQVTLK
jgi:hypothetical protein